MEILLFEKKFAIFSVTFANNFDTHSTRKLELLLFLQNTDTGHYIDIGPNDEMDVELVMERSVKIAMLLRNFSLFPRFRQMKALEVMNNFDWYHIPIIREVIQ